MSDAKQLFMEVSLSTQKQSFSEVEALNTFRGPQGLRGEPGSIDNLVINGKEAVPVDGKNTINLTPADVGALGKNEKAVDADKLNGKGAEFYATDEAVDQLSQQKVDKANVVNNFTTTQEGFVADARAMKALNDAKLNIANAFFGSKSTYTEIAVSDFDAFIDGVTTTGNMVQTAINKLAVQHGDYYFGNLQYVLYSINFEKNYGWVLSISFSGIFWGIRRNTSTFTWKQIA